MAASLTEQFSPADKRKKLVDEALELLDAEVKDKSGLSGMAVKTAFKLVSGVQPGFIRRVVEHLLDDFLVKMDPIYQDALREGRSPGALVTSRKSEVASALLSVTDQRAERAQSEMVRKTYNKLRPTAQKHVEAAGPRLSKLLDRLAAPS
jgi:hypothetical protein